MEQRNAKVPKHALFLMILHVLRPSAWGVRSLVPHCMMPEKRTSLGLNKSFREILPYHTSFPRLQKWETSQLCYGTGFVSSERSYWEKYFMDIGKLKIIT